MAKYRLEAKKTSSSGCIQISERYGQYLNFVITNGWLQSLYQRMKSTRRIAITKATWLEVKATFLHDIVEDEIPDELILNFDQTPSKFVPRDNVTMAEKSSKHVSRRGSNDKCRITVTLAETLSGQIPQFPVIYTGKTSHSLPHVKFPAGFCLSYNEKHWSNKAKTMALVPVNKIIYPYVTKFKEELGLAESQKALLAWDVFKAQSTDNVLSNLEKLNITHLLQPLDLTTNASVKKMEKRGFNDYFTFS